MKANDAYSSADAGWQSRYHREGVCNVTYQNDWVVMSDMAIYGEVFTALSLHKKYKLNCYKEVPENMVIQIEIFLQQL